MDAMQANEKTVFTAKNLEARYGISRSQFWRLGKTRGIYAPSFKIHQRNYYHISHVEILDALFSGAIPTEEQALAELGKKRAEMRERVMTTPAPVKRRITK